jgi:hypothetical protein
MAFYATLADGVLVLHLAIVLFVIGGLVAIVVGHGRDWPLVDGMAFRLAHLGAIAFVVAQAWLGQECPLTTLESWLRTQAGTTGYATGFIEHWVGRILYYQAPPWVFNLAYSVFGALVALAWWRFPPRRGRAR